MLAVLDANDPTMNRSIPCACLVLLIGAAQVAEFPALPAPTTPTAQAVQTAPTTPVTQTADSGQARAKLAEVRARIAALTATLGSRLKERDAEAARLREADLTITAMRGRLENLRAALAAAERRRAELRIEQARNQAALDAQTAALGAQVRAAYMIGRQEQIKLLLNQSDPASAGRMLEYYGYFARARSANIEEIHERALRVRQSAAAALEAGAKLKGLQADMMQGMKALQLARAERVAALAAASVQVNAGTELLEQLKREERAEEALLADLARVLQDFPVESQQGFDTLRGRLPWPVAGRMNPGRSGLRRNGVLIDTARGTKVRAPYFGRVVYADWLQGLGLLLIIGHSGNYMTLYGHAEVLYKSVGDWVAPGDVIAALSDAGGGTPQLYFEIRDGRKAVDPKRWLKPSP